MLLKGESMGCVGSVSSPVLSKGSSGGYQLLFYRRIFAGNLAEFCLLVFHPNGIFICFYLYKNVGFSVYCIRC